LEQVFGPIKTAGLILLFAVVPNALEFAFLTGGIGLSCVGYGFFGLLWVVASRDERFRDAIDQRTIQVFVVWFFVCIVATLTNLMLVANIAHAGGGVLGILAGLAIARPDRRFLSSLVSSALFSWRSAPPLSGGQYSTCQEERVTKKADGVTTPWWQTGTGVMRRLRLISASCTREVPACLEGRPR